MDVHPPTLGAHCSDQFPAFIPFWITIHGIPLHYWTKEAPEAIGEGLGLVEATDVVKGRVRVHINGLKPLEKFLDISLEGETKQVELEYEKLDKHCFSCLSLSHEVKDCPSRTTNRNTSDQNLGISQRRTLERIEENRRRADNRKQARFTPYEDSRNHRRTDHSQGNQGYYNERPENRNHHYDGRREHLPDRSLSNRSFSANEIRERDITRSREPTDTLPPIRETSDVSLRSRGMRSANPPVKNVWRHVSGDRENGRHSNSVQSQVSHTPSPLPPRERITSPNITPQGTPRPAGENSATPSARRSALERLSDGDTNASTGERRSALARISTPPHQGPSTT
ncbi:cyclin-dependent kinase 11A-like [Brassica napus]|uniref:cyclin-dependent kinase 11A-like n=1 Tax=Brassica napus TaxID=3708 RepID=UPI002079D9F3|nr:cyclin-dependent kinase 11A-like [Brassica napus]